MNEMSGAKCAYICGPLTELGKDEQQSARDFYERIADLCLKVLGVRAFVPHEHYDPIKMASFTPQQVDEAERWQIIRSTSVLIVTALAPSWGGGIEVEIANTHGVPVILLCEKEKLGQGRISRLLRGNPAVRQIIIYTDRDDVLRQLEEVLSNPFPPVAPIA